MTIPEHYQRLFRCYLRFVIVMMIVALLLGITFQESAKKTPFSMLSAGVHLETIINLALVHGHAFMIGVLIPMAVTWMLYLGLALGYPPVGEKPLRVGSWHYLPASVVAILLMLYKGYHFQLAARGGQTDFAAINEAYFMGNHVLRALAYGLTHTAMAVGLGILVISFWKTMKPLPNTK
jgi:hypothetical protein